MIYFILYDLAFLLFLGLFFPVLWRRIKPDREYPGDWNERFGIYPGDIKKKLKERKTIWFQTVSVGELLSITPLLKLLKEKHPDERIVLTVTTKTGRKIARENFPDITCFFFPLDFYFIVKQAVKFLNPKLIVLVETELWPNLLRISRTKKIPVIIINGRISPRSFSRYRKFRLFTKKVLPFLSEIAMRTEEEAQRIIFLGAEKEKIKIAGSIKFDQAFSLSEEMQPDKIREKYGIPENKKVIVFGSLHPGEESDIVNVCIKLINKYPDILFVIAPRFLNRTNIFKVLAEKRIQYAKRSKLPENKELSLWIIDTYGELNNFYSICECAFVGGSLVGWGGQNPIEPAAFKKPVIFGKYKWHFFEEWGKIKSGGGGIEVEDYNELYEKICFLLENPEIAKQLGEKAFHVVSENKGATAKNLKIIEKYL